MHIKPYFSLGALLIGATLASQAQTPKYVFYFITDGTSFNAMLGTEHYLAELQDRWGREPLCSSQFPVVGVASTYSGNSGITDSAASGTCLATGTKTYNGAIGVGMDTTNVYSVAYLAHKAGFPVGVASSVCINHATPAAFYAHSKSRSRYYEIALQAPETGFDFFGGPDFTIERDKKTPENREALYKKCEKAGYTIARGYQDYEAKAEKAKRMILCQPLERTLNVDDNSLPYAIDAKPGEMSVYDVLKAEIDFLYHKSEQKGHKGFFIMNEIGGKVDYACHAHDAATAFREICLVDSCMRLAYDFYLQHPDETLILLTSDHETGGISLGVHEGGYATNFRLLANQKCSLDALTYAMGQLRQQTKNHVTWEQMKELLHDKLGFWGNVKISHADEALLLECFAKNFEGRMVREDNLYSSNEMMAVQAIKMLNSKAHIGWTSGHHTAGIVPVYACGVGAELFCRHNDNSTFAPVIARLAGYVK